MAALEETLPGDTLIVALEPGLLTDPLEAPALGVQFAVATGHWDWLCHALPPVRPMGGAAIALALRPGGMHTFTMLAKWIGGQKLYRYQPGDMRLSGFNQTSVRVPITGPPGHGVTLPESNLKFLQSLADWCGGHRVRLAYSLPWGYTPEDQVAGFQRDNIRFLLQVARIMPVLKDPRFGAYSVLEHFADTAWHLDETGSALRTDELGVQVKEWRVWTVEELEAAFAVLQTDGP
jgi:hypothetical protein